MTDREVQMRLLGDFSVEVDGHEVPASAWPTRRAADLVQLLALTPRHRLTREQAIEALWPQLSPDAGAANLRKAAHHARRALGHRDGVVLRGGSVSLFPDSEVRTDVEVLVQRARAELAEGSPGEAARLAGFLSGELLPDSPYEEWTRESREEVRSLRIALLRHAGAWRRLVQLDPTDEPAYRELMRAATEEGNISAAIDWYGRLRTALHTALGVTPDPESRRLYDQCVASLSQPEPALVGRARVIAELTALLRSADPRRCGVVAIRGPAGIGKSALCRRLLTLAEEEGWQAASVVAGDTPVAYGVVTGVLEQLLDADPGLESRVGREAARVIHALWDVAAGSPRVERRLTRQQVIGALQRLVTAAAERAPALIVVDDADRADDASLAALLQGLSGDTPSALLVLAYRPEGALEVLAHGVLRHRRAGWATTIDLGPLSEDDARALVAAESGNSLAEDRIHEVIERGEGNPFFLSELAHRAGTGPERLQPDLAEAVSIRFVDLDAGTVAMLSRLALVEDELALSDVTALTGMTEDEAFAVLDAGLAAGVVVVADTRYRFRHQLVRQALADRLAPHQQVAVHRDAARRLATAGAQPAVVARHWLAGERPGEATPWLLSAARTALDLGAFRDALALTEPLLAHAPSHPEGLLLRARAIDGLGDARAPAAYATAANSVVGRYGDDLRAQQALSQLKLGDPTGALHTLDGLEPVGFPGRLARALTLSGAASMGFGDVSAAAEAATEAQRLAVEAGDSNGIVQASWAAGLAAHARGELAASVRASLENTYEMPVLAGHVFDGMLCAVERMLYGARPYAEVISFADSLADEAHRLGASRGYAFAVTLRGEAELFLGRLDDAEADLVEGQRLHERMGAALGTALALQRRAEAAHQRHEDDRALRLADEALAVARESDAGFHLLDRVHGVRISASSDPDSIVPALEDAEVGIQGPLETCPGCRITLAVPAAIGATRAADRDRITRYAMESEILAGVVMPLPAWQASVEEIHGRMARLDGDVAAAVRHLEAATGIFTRIGHALDADRCQELLRAVS